MTTSLREIISSSFGSLAEKHGLHQQKEVNDAQSYSLEYSSKYFTLKLEKYRDEFYATLYKQGNSDKEIGLFNLLAYLAGPLLDCPAAEYFHNESNIEERYRKQLIHIATALDQHFTAISDFLEAEDYASKAAKVNEFMVNKYPELFKTS